MANVQLDIRSNMPEGVIKFDEYGFAVFLEDQGDIERNHVYRNQDYSTEHRMAWQTYLDMWPESFTTSPNKLRYLLRRGLPRTLRPLLWSKLLGCEQQSRTSTFSYRECVRALRSQLVELNVSEYCLRPNHSEVWDADEDGTAKGPPKKDEPKRMRHLIPLQILRQIIVDLERTFPTHHMFMGSRPEAKEGKAALFRLLSVYALYNPDVGYCQGMSYIVGMLLMEIHNEEDVFWAMVALFEKPKYLSGYFDNRLTRIQSHATTFHRLLRQRHPRLTKHFDSLGVQALMYVTPWFMCLYTSLPCWDTVLAIWDLIFLDGVSTIFRVGLSLVDVNRELIAGEKDLTKILRALLHPTPDRVTLDKLMPVIWKTTVENWEIDALQAVIAEESDPYRSARKRRHYTERGFGDTVQEMKRIRLEEKPKPVPAPGGFFQRVINMFTPRNQRGMGQSAPATSTEVHHPIPDTEKRRPGHNRVSYRVGGRVPGSARMAKTSGSDSCKSVIPDGANQPTSVRTGSRTVRLTSMNQLGHDKNKVNGETSSTLSACTPNADKNKYVASRAAVANLPKYTPSSPGRSRMFGRLHAQIFGTEVQAVATVTSHPLADISDTMTSSPERPAVSDRPTRQSAQKTSHRNWLSPDCNRHIQLPSHHHGNRSGTSKTPTHPTSKESPGVFANKENLSTPGSSRRLRSENTLKSRQAPSIESLNSSTDGVRSFTEDFPTDGVWQYRIPLDLSPSHSPLNNNYPSSPPTTPHSMRLRPNQYTPGMYSHKTPKSEARPHVTWKNPMNVPSTRRLVCRTARAQHSFKSFHTPTPLRKSKVLNTNISPLFSSPEVELMTITKPGSPINLDLSGIALAD